MFSISLSSVSCRATAALTVLQITVMLTVMFDSAAAAPAPPTAPSNVDGWTEYTGLHVAFVPSPTVNVTTPAALNYTLRVHSRQLYIDTNGDFIQQQALPKLYQITFPGVKANQIVTKFDWKEEDIKKDPANSPVWNVQDCDYYVFSLTAVTSEGESIRVYNNYLTQPVKRKSCYTNAVGTTWAATIGIAFGSFLLSFVWLAYKLKTDPNYK